jgi:DNA replicative helicase MCM subunit Mcm2 (Cdc46/Mcm family)
MVFTFQGHDNGESSILEHYSRKDRVRRALTAFMAYQSGYLSQYGLSISAINSRVDETEQQFFSDIPAPRRVALRPFDTQFGLTEKEVIRIDAEVLRRGHHIPPINSQVVQQFPAPLTILVNEGSPQAFSEQYTDYADFHHWLTNEMAFVVEGYPEVLTDCMKQMWRTFGVLINDNMRVRLIGEAFIPPDVFLSGNVPELSINDVLSTSAYDGRLVTITGQVLEMGDVRKRPIRIAWKCMVGNCGMLSFTTPDPFEDENKKPDECSICQAGNSDSTIKASFVQDGAPNTTFITYQRLMARQTDTQMTTPPQMLMELRGLQVFSVNQGEDVAMTGIFRTVSDPRSGNKMERIPLLFVTDVRTTSRDSVVEVTEVEELALRAWKEEHDFEEIIEMMTRATAPRVIGHRAAKQALILQAVGGYAGLSDGKRKFIHLLFMGDPGTAKTELKKFALSIHPASKEATGARTSIVGLIGGKSENQRLLGSSTTTLSPGMLALIPDGAIAAVDELHALGDPRIFSMLNDAMESGVVSVQMQMKGTIRTPTPVLGLANPMRGDNTKFDLTSGEPLLDQSGLPVSFASRFDVIICFLDRVDEARDEAIINGMLNSVNNTLNNPNAVFPITDGYNKYLQLSRQVAPQDQPLSEDAVKKISKIFIKARQGSAGGATVNFRWGAALARLACAAARLDLSSQVQTRHVDFAHKVLSESLTTTDPDMVVEGGSGLSTLQTERYEYFKVQVDEYFLSRNSAIGDRDGLHEFVRTKWDKDPVDMPKPSNVEMDLHLDRWAKESIAGVKLAPKRIEYLLL